jgi:hypothetical protein
MSGPDTLRAGGGDGSSLGQLVAAGLLKGQIFEVGSVALFAYAGELDVLGAKVSNHLA